jgi:hypothetical protein
LSHYEVATSYYGVAFLSPRFFGGSTNKYLMVLITVLSEIPGRLAPLLVMDRFGRRKSLGIMSKGCGVRE